MRSPDASTPPAPPTVRVVLGVLGVVALVVLGIGVPGDQAVGAESARPGIAAARPPTALPTPSLAADAVDPDSTLPPLPAHPRPLTASTTSPPVRVQLPTLGVDSPLEPLGLLGDGSLAPPSTFEQAGWYDAGVVPGDPGPAIIAGHVDSRKGPAVFYDLRRLQAGDPVVVTRADGSVVRFTVEAAAQYPKAQFPTAEVYGPTPTPELRLITCTGIFDRSVRSYEDNHVVTAILSP